MKTILYGKVVLPHHVLERGAVLFENDLILDVGPRQQVTAAGANIIEHDGYITPGFVDIHVHGGRGADFMDGTAEAFRIAIGAHRAHGTTSIVPTTTVASRGHILRVLETCRAEMRSETYPARILGVHFYGPYFGKEAAGCHPTDDLADPDPREYFEYLEYKDAIVSATVAPELPGAESFARACLERGIVVNAGHSHCTFDQAQRAIEWGVRHVDHLFCAMSDRARLRQRQIFPMRGGLMEATLFFDQLTTEVIADGKHLARELLQLAFKIKGPDKLALMTDSSRALDMPDGDYIFGPIDVGRPFRREDGVGVTPDGKALASAVMGMDHMVRTFHKATGCTVPEVIRMATLTPARIVKRDEKIGSLSPGKFADLLLLDSDLGVRQVWLAGKPVGSNELFDQ
ncbi:MAG: amidohydrolase family protein [Planctomycetota bacterium]